MGSRTSLHAPSARHNCFLDWKRSFFTRLSFTTVSRETLRANDPGTLALRGNRHHVSPGAQTRPLCCPLHAENETGKSETGESSRGWHSGRGRARDTLGAYATPRLDAPERAKRTARLARLQTGVTRAAARTVHDQRLLKGGHRKLEIIVEKLRRTLVPCQQTIGPGRYIRTRCDTPIRTIIHRIAPA